MSNGFNILDGVRNLQGADPKNRSEDFNILDGLEGVVNSKIEEESDFNITDIPKERLEKAEANILEKDQNIVFKLLEQINRPQYGVANAIYQAAVNDNYDVMKNIWDGLTLTEKRSIGDVLKENIQPDTKVGRIATAVAGFTGDVLTDPLTYIGVGLVARGGKLIKSGTQASKLLKAGRVAGRDISAKSALTLGIPFTNKVAVIPKTDKIIDPLAKGASKFRKVLREDLGPVSDTIDKLRVVSTKLRPKGVDPVFWESYKRLENFSKNVNNQILSESFDVARAVSRKFNKEGLTREQIGEITNKIETGMTENLGEGGELAVSFMKKLQDKYKNVGSSVKKVIQEDGYFYVPHVANEKQAKKFGLGIKEFSTITPADLSRKYLKFVDKDGAKSILQVRTKKLFRDGKEVGKLGAKQISKLKAKATDGVPGLGRLTPADTIEEVNTGLGIPLFTDDLPRLIAIQGARTAKAVGSDEFFKRVINLGSKEQKPGYVQSTAEELKGLYYPKPIADGINNTYKSLTNYDGINKIADNIKKITQAWKLQATIWSPSFHTRNAISNYRQNSVAGAFDLGDSVKAGDMLRKRRFDPTSLKAGEKKILKEFDEQGLIRTGWAHGDVSKSIDDEIKGVFDYVREQEKIGGKVIQGLKVPFRTLNKVGGGFGEMVEDSAKLAHYMTRRKQGFSPFDAGQSVKKWLFDYSDLTDTEKKLRDFFIPFYTWTRKNIPLQLESLVTAPEKQTRILKLKNNIEVLTGEKGLEPLLPEWLRNASPMFVGGSGKSGDPARYIKLEGFLPVGDINRLSDPVKNMLTMLNPVMLKAGEQLFNKNVFFGKPVTEQKGLEGFKGIPERDFLWWRIPGRLEHMGRIFSFVSTIEKVTGRMAKKRGDDVFDKMINVMLSGKTYQFTDSELRQRFNFESDAEAKIIKKQMRRLEFELGKSKYAKEIIRNDLKTMRKKYQEALREGQKKRVAASKLIRERRRGR